MFNLDRVMERSALCTVCRPELDADGVRAGACERRRLNGAGFDEAVEVQVITVWMVFFRC